MIYLIILDFFWSGAALAVDLSKLGTIYPLLWPLVLVCPIYPFLLAFVWVEIKKGRKPNPYLLAFAAIPSAIFGVLALLYYPSRMIFQGFWLRDFGQIFWVLFYAVQGWYLILRKEFQIKAVMVVCAFLFIKFVLDYKFKTFGYLWFDGIPQLLIFLMFLVALFCTFGIAFFLTKKK